MTNKRTKTKTKTKTKRGSCVLSTKCKCVLKLENHYFPHDTVDLGSFNKGGKLSLEIKRR